MEINFLGNLIRKLNINEQLPKKTSRGDELRWRKDYPILQKKRGSNRES